MPYVPARINRKLVVVVVYKSLSVLAEHQQIAMKRTLLCILFYNCNVFLLRMKGACFKNYYHANFYDDTLNNTSAAATLTVHTATILEMFTILVVVPNTFLRMKMGLLIFNIIFGK
jgi:hypothetical protein